jgi:hypothetical protein
MSIKQFPGGVITKSPTAPTTAAAKGIWTLGQASDFVKQGIWPRSPGTPTIGTATAVTYQTATVTYTVPSDLGTGTVTYTATSSPGSYTGTGASPITVSGLSASTSYTFTVTAATPGGTSAASAASNSITTPAAPPTVIGQAYGGGYYAGEIGVSSVATHYIVVGPVASAQNTSIQYKNANSATPGADSDINGPQNTADIVADGNSTVYPAGHFCNDLVIGGYSDWYMPAKNELEVCYYNLKPTTASNRTSYGINPNAVPARASNYTAGNPAQTSATDFQSTGAEDFLTGLPQYWASTEASTNYAWRQDFGYGGQYNNGDKSSLRRVRAIRRVAV